MAPKYRFIADMLRREAESGRYRDGGLLPTERQLCERFAVSRQTVRRALFILEEEGRITRRQGSGSYLCRPQSAQALSGRTVAVVTTSISDYIFPHILRGVEAVLSANGCVPLLFATQNRISLERRILQTLLAREELDGMLVEGTQTALPNPNLDLYEKLLARGVRIVFINGIYPELAGTPSVLADDRGGGRMLAEYLHAKGHRDIAGIFKSDDMQGTLRYAGFAQALRDLGLPMEDARLFWYDTETKASFRSDAFTERILRRFAGCSAIVCYNDEVAVRIVSGLNRLGVRIPQKMAVVSFDNSQYSELALVRITSLSHGTQNLGELSAGLMLRLLNGEACESVAVSWQLEEKESS